MPSTLVADEASIVPDVNKSRAFSSAADIFGLDSVTASSPRPLIPAETNAAATSARVPVTSVTAEASITPVVLPSSVLRTEAAAVVLDSVIASSPLPLIPAAE